MEVKFSDFDELAKRVSENGNVLTVTMGQLRDAYKAEKLGVNVRDNIGKMLAGMGLAYHPKPLPTYQDELARIYKQGTPVADLIDAVLNKPTVENDEVIRGRVNESDTSILNKIRELIEI